MALFDQNTEEPKTEEISAEEQARIDAKREAKRKAKAERKAAEAAAQSNNKSQVDKEEARRQKLKREAELQYLGY